MDLRKAFIGLLIICAGTFVFVVCVCSMNATASTSRNHISAGRNASVVKETLDRGKPDNSDFQRRGGQATNISVAPSSRLSIDAVEKEPGRLQPQIDTIEIEPGEIRLPPFYGWDEQPAIGEEYTLSVDQ